MCVLHANACVYGLLYQCVLSESSVFFYMPATCCDAYVFACVVCMISHML